MFRRKTFELAHHRFKLASFEEKSIEYQHPVKPMAELITRQIQTFNKWLPSVVYAKVQDYFFPIFRNFFFQNSPLAFKKCSLEFKLLPTSNTYDKCFILGK